VLPANFALHTGLDVLQRGELILGLTMMGIAEVMTWLTGELRVVQHSVPTLSSEMDVPSLTIAGLLMAPNTPRGFRLAVGVLPPA
jgi:hypothetical protein